MATAVQGYLKAAGIELAVDPVQMASYNNLGIMGKGFDGLIHVLGAAQVDPLLSYVNMATGVEFNNMLKPQEFKDTYAKAVTATDQETKKKLVWELLYLSIDKYCMQTFFWAEATQYATNIKLKDITISPNTRIDCSKAWLSK